jgi:hypothetical protein
MKLVGTTVAAACLAALVATAPAAAHDKRAKVSRAKLTATPAAEAAGIPDVKGRAQLVDGKRRNKVSLHVRGLKAGETYLWHVHQAKAEGDPCAPDSEVADPTPYPGWTYRALVANEAGNANSKGRSETFPVETESTGDYYVNVHLQDGTVIACGVLERSRGARKHDDKAGHHGRPDHARGHAHGRNRP